MLALLFATLALAVPVHEVPSPRAHDGWVTDLAEVLEPADEERLDATIDALHADVGVEIAVVTVDEVPGTPKQFATELFNHWGIGRAETDNGLLVLLVMGARRLEMETGDGMGHVLPHQWLKSMQAQQMVPRFKEGDFGAGLVAGIEAVDERLREGPVEDARPAVQGERDPATASHAPEPAPDAAPARAPVPEAADPSPAPQTYEPPPPRTPWDRILAWMIAGLATVGAGGSLIHRRWRRRFCPQCDEKMLQLDEVADDSHLDAGQRAEERVGSRNWVVRICPSCQASRVFARNKWFSGYSRCDACSYKTLKRTSTTLVAATYDHGGKVRVTESCKHCGHHDSWTRRTSKKTRPSSSSSSSSSSFSSGSSYSSSSSSSGFSGGSSSGGGAGSSW